jgi:hypothetical protein
MTLRSVACPALAWSHNHAPGRVRRRWIAENSEAAADKVKT